MEAQGDPFRRGLPTLQTSLTHPELPPRAPALTWRRFDSFCLRAGTLGGSFCRFGRLNSFTKCGYRTLFVGGYLRNASHYQSGAKPHHITNCTSRPNPKLPRKTPPLTKSETNFHFRNGGVLRGSSGWVREAWRAGRHLRKGSPCASKVFLTLSVSHTAYGRRLLRQTCGFCRKPLPRYRAPSRRRLCGGRCRGESHR